MTTAPPSAIPDWMPNPPCSSAAGDAELPTSQEVNRLFAVTRNLRLNSSDEELAQRALDWLTECLPGTGCCILLSHLDESVKVGAPANQRFFRASGQCPVSKIDFLAIVEPLEAAQVVAPTIVDESTTSASGSPDALARPRIVAPLVEAERTYGWLAVFHRPGGSFGPREANLVAWLGTLLGGHCGNRDLYRQQSELLSNTVRALVSAIDAKDPYTSGHSDRVARFAVRIALEMRCSPKFLNTIYMAGLLHDVGKIGIDDSVLRKTGRLTDQEFEHIKRHPEMGFRILYELKPLADVLPAVLHHHEQWDGTGYPLGLSGEDIPLIARILAVADAYDAMTSDRPYRRGMDEERVDEIFRNGAGKHWDQEVVNAFFRSQQDIRTIAHRERPPVDMLSQEML